MIFICLYPDFLLRGKESNEGVLWAKIPGSKSKRHLQRTVSCSWGILQGWHHTARWSDKEESPFQLGRSSTGCCLLLLDPFVQKCPSTSEATLGALTHHSLPLPPLFTILLSVFVHLQGRTMAVCAPHVHSRPAQAASSLPAHLLFLFWSDMVGGCFDVL